MLSVDNKVKDWLDWAMDERMDDENRQANVEPDNAQSSHYVILQRC